MQHTLENWHMFVERKKNLQIFVSHLSRSILFSCLQAYPYLKNTILTLKFHLDNTRKIEVTNSKAHPEKGRKASHNNF